MSRWAVCPTCQGQGTHVNAAIDSQGLTAEDFEYAGPEFAEDYFSGVYDVTCAECGGRRVVPRCAHPTCDRAAEAKPAGWGDRRESVSTEHYECCHEHLSAVDRVELEEVASTYEQEAMERRMGA